MTTIDSNSYVFLGAGAVKSLRAMAAQHERMDFTAKRGPSIAFYSRRNGHVQVAM